MPTHLDWLDEEIQSLKDLGYYNRIRTISSAQGPRLEIDGRSLLNLCSNKYRGLANHPHLVDAARRATKKYGAGPAAVRTIACERCDGVGSRARTLYTVYNTQTVSVYQELLRQVKDKEILFDCVKNLL